MKNLELKLEGILIESLVSVLGLSKSVLESLRRLISGGVGGP